MSDAEAWLRAAFSLDERGFLHKDGPARGRGEAVCQKKLCFTAITLEPLARLLHTLSSRQDCWFVKVDSEPGPHGMVRGRCFLTTPEAVGAVWKQYKVTDEILCSVQDDEFTKEFR